jgi:DNA-binding XRE family transcriptional regulator
MNTDIELNNPNTSGNSPAGDSQKCVFTFLDRTFVVFGDIPSAVSARFDVVESKVTRLPEKTAYSFEDIYALLGQRGRAAAASERQSLDASLRSKLRKGEITALYFYRVLCRMTQQDLAKSVGSRQGFISQLEKGRRPLTWKQAKKFAEALGVMPKQLLPDEK